MQRVIKKCHLVDILKVVSACGAYLAHGQFITPIEVVKIKLIGPISW